jgi:oxygen-dependent protoporphyrinogen oxidase
MEPPSASIAKFPAALPPGAIFPAMKPRILVLGGGMTGLAAAVRIFDLIPNADLQLWEAQDRLGGILQTDQTGEFLLELSADNFLNQEPYAANLAARVGLAGELIPTNSGERRACVLRGAQILPVPRGFVLMAPREIWPLLKTPLLSWPGKLRMLAELLIPARPPEQHDESLESFARRRFGDEAFERLIQPLIGGIYTADPAKLSLAATLPKFLEWERRSGSVIQAALEEQSANQSAHLYNPDTHAFTGNGSSSEGGARYSQFFALRKGMSQFVTALANRLPASAIRLQTRGVECLPNPRGPGWLVKAASHEHAEHFHAVIVTLPAYAAADLFAAARGTLAAELAGIQYAGSSVALMAYRKEQFTRALAGFGLVVPAVERRKIIAVSYSSEKFPGRAPAGVHLLRVFVGGALQPELAELPDAELTALVHEELREIYGIRGTPLLTRLARWPKAMPQYHLGHLERIARIEAECARLPGLELAGAAYRGVGIPQCIRGGEQAAERIAAFLLATSQVQAG